MNDVIQRTHNGYHSGDLLILAGIQISPRVSNDLVPRAVGDAAVYLATVITRAFSFDSSMMGFGLCGFSLH